MDVASQDSQRPKIQLQEELRDYMEIFSTLFQLNFQKTKTNLSVSQCLKYPKYVPWVSPLLLENHKLARTFVVETW